MNKDIYKIFSDSGVDIILQSKPRWNIRDSNSSLKKDTPDTLESLKLEALNIDCELKKYANNLVFGEGNEHPDILIIGEAPGAEEDLQGRPFVGQSGQLLIKALKAIGLTREDVYITNTIPWRPVMNRTPTLAEVDLFLPIKKRQIEILNPKIILCVGATAAKIIIGQNVGIMKIRGQWFKYNENILVLATFHPAYLLRSPTQKKFFWQDLIKLKIKCEELSNT